jgi:acetyl esterase/lipase
LLGRGRAITLLVHPVTPDTPLSTAPLARRRVSLGILSLALGACTGGSSVLAAGPDAGPQRRTLAAGTRKLRVLCLHGYHGSGRVLRSQMARLAAALEPLAELVFIDAPSLAAGDYGWWHAVDAERDPASDDPGVDGPRRHYKGWTRTRDAIVAAFAAQGPFDGVVGFSQGAALAGLLVGLRAPDGTPTSERPLAFGFAIVISGFPSNDPELARLYDRKDSYTLPSLHMFGRSDGIVPMDDSRALAARFADPVLVEHGSGHVVASEAAVTGRVRAFLEDRIRERDAASGGKKTDTVRKDPFEVALWPNKTTPTMRAVLPRRADGALAPALVVFRGGGYQTSLGSGGGSAEWAADHGMVGVEVPYRTQATGDAYPAGYADAARAVRIVRQRAAKWGVDPARVGVLGYSAGGHLASLLSTQPTVYVDPDDDLAARVSARPDFVLLAYPVISFVDGYAPHALAGTAESFFGRQDVPEDLRRQFSNELHVTREHPPVFVWTTADDELVPSAHSRIFAEACERAGVPVTFRLYPHGPHAMGLALNQQSDVRGWTEAALAWLRARGIVEAGLAR